MKRLSVISLLTRYASNVYKKDTNYDIANALLKNYCEITSLTIHDMADKCYVSTASLARFVQLLGFRDYPSFKNACKNSVDIRVDYSLETSRATSDDVEPIFSRYTNHVKDNLDYILQSLDYEQINSICEKIYDASYVAFLGLEFAILLGNHFQVKMAELNRPIMVGNTAMREKEIVDSLDENSVVIIASLEGGYFYYNNDIIEVLKEKKAKIIALTMSNTSMVKNFTNDIIISSLYNSDTEGRISLLYVIELLLMFYVINFKDKTN